MALDGEIGVWKVCWGEELDFDLVSIQQLEIMARVTDIERNWSLPLRHKICLSSHLKQ